MFYYSMVKAYKEGPKMPYLTGPEYQLLDKEGFRGGDGNPVPPNEYPASHYAKELSNHEERLSYENRFLT